MATDAGAIVEGQGPAAGGGELNMLDMVEEFSKRGNQIFVSLRKGKDSPPTSCDVRAQYEETILDLKKKVEEATGVPVDKQLLFWHFKELTSEYDNKTLLDLNLHTGFSLTGYDLVSCAGSLSLLARKYATPSLPTPPVTTRSSRS
mmetsp:Transcript_6814/g.16671  ORF Transcript_6814/g.16671 Transcript_6814/m.16671 type:complete len:146 (-) Transcript_6814:464-901(-)